MEYFLFVSFVIWFHLMKYFNLLSRFVNWMSTAVNIESSGTPKFVNWIGKFIHSLSLSLFNSIGVFPFAFWYGLKSENFMHTHYTIVLRTLYYSDSDDRYLPGTLITDSYKSKHDNERIEPRANKYAQNSIVPNSRICTVGRITLEIEKK